MRAQSKLPAFLAGVLLALGACPIRAREATIYSSVDQVFAEPILREAQARGGPPWKAVFDTEEAKSTGVLNRLLAEASRPRADVFWSGDPMRAQALVRRGLAERYVSPQAGAIPAAFKAADGSWTGVGARARLLLVNRKRVAPAETPRSVKDLALPRWKGQAAIANPLFGTTTMHVAALFVAWGDEAGRAFLEGLRRNEVKIAASNGEVKRLVVSGEAAFGIVDSDDAAEAVREGAPVEIVWPDQDGLGTLVMPTALVLVKGGPNTAAGKALVDRLLEPEAERRLAESGHLSLRADVAALPGEKRIADIRAMAVDYPKVAETMERIQPWLREWVGL
jgi:iron(III) transport system substrate-binding protein